MNLNLLLGPVVDLGCLRAGVRKIKRAPAAAAGKPAHRKLECNHAETSNM